MDHASYRSPHGWLADGELSWECSEENVRLGSAAESGASASLLRSIKSRLSKWYTREATVDGLRSFNVAMLKSWANAVLEQQTWNAHACLRMVLAAILFLLEVALIEAEAERSPDISPILAATRGLVLYFALSEQLPALPQRLAVATEIVEPACSYGAERPDVFPLLVGEVRVMEAASRVMRMLKRLVGQDIGDNCGCFHQGWDYFIGLHGHLAKTLGNPALRTNLLHEQSYERSVIMSQNCEGETWVPWNLDASEALRRAAVGTLCIQGDIALLLLCSTQALLLGEADRALKGMDYASVFSVLMMDCLPSHQWSFGARDVLRNAGKLMWLREGGEVADTLPSRLLWSMCPAFEGRREVNWVRGGRLRALSVEDDRAMRGSCSATLHHVCLSDGELTIYDDVPGIADLGAPLEVTDSEQLGAAALESSSVEVFMPFCNDYGVGWVRARQRAAVLPFASHWQPSGAEALFLPVASLYNPEHALHWLLAALVHVYSWQRSREWNMTRLHDVQLVIYFDPRGTILDESLNKSWMRTFFALLSDREPIFWDKTNGPVCWEKMVWGTGTFNLRYSTFNKVDSRVFMHTEQLVRQTSSFRGWDVSTLAVRWRCAADVDNEDSALLDGNFWDIRPADGRLIYCGKCSRCKRRWSLGQAASEVRLNAFMVQRPAGIGRHILNFHNLVAAVKSYEATVDVHSSSPSSVDGQFADHETDLNPVAQLLSMPRIDLLIGSYGAALTFGAFMNSGVILELFPPLPDSTLMLCLPGWNANAFTVYGGLAKQSRQQHACLSSAYHPDMGELRPWRDMPIIINERDFSALVGDAIAWLLKNRYGTRLEGTEPS